MFRRFYRRLCNSFRQYSGRTFCSIFRKRQETQLIDCGLLSRSRSILGAQSKRLSVFPNTLPSLLKFGAKSGGGIRHPLVGETSGRPLLTTSVDGSLARRRSGKGTQCLSRPPTRADGGGAGGHSPSQLCPSPASLCFAVGSTEFHRVFGEVRVLCGVKEFCSRGKDRR